MSSRSEVGGLLDLGHDVGGEAAGKPGAAGREVFGVDRRGGRQRVVPAVPADRLQEAAQPADVMGMAHLAAHFRLQDGQVALQQRAGHAGQARQAARAGRRARRRTGSPPGPGSRPCWRDSPVASCQRVYLLASSRSQGWGIPAKLMVASGWSMPRLRSRQMSRGYSVSQPAPKASASTAAARVEDERAPAVPLSRRVRARPPVFGLLQQGGRARGGQDRDERVTLPGRQSRVLLIAAALQHVLHLQPEPGGQLPQVDVLLAGSRVLAGGGELIDTGTPVVLPAGVVAVAEHRRAAGPQGAVADPAGAAAARPAAAAWPAPASPPGPGVPCDTTG